MQEHDRRMDAAMKKIEDGKILVSQGESAIKDAHRDVVDVMRRILGDSSGATSDKRASSGTVLEV